MEPHSISMEEDLNNAAKQVEVFAISFYLDPPFPPFPLSLSVLFLPLISERAEIFLVH
jgi:hypothetical protein